MPRISRFLTAATLVAATLSVAACGSSSSGSGSTGSSPAGQASQGSSPSSGGGSTTDTLCSLTTKGEVSAVLGKPAANTPTENIAHGCTWPPADANIQGTATIAMAPSSSPVTDITGMASGALCTILTTPQVGEQSCLNSDSHQLWFAKGSKVFAVVCELASDAALVTWAQAVAGRA